jgi:hypothetical protein
VSLKSKILFIFLIMGLSLNGQSFMYSYIDPCTRESKFITTDMNSPIVISYYGQIRTFSYAELQDGTFDFWLNDIYNKYKTTSPCQGAVTTTTTTTSTNLASNVVNSVMNLNSIANVGSIGSVGVNVGGNTSQGSGSVGGSDNKQKNDNKENQNNNPDNNGDNNSGNNTSGSSSGSSSNGSNNGSGSGSSSSGSSSSGSSGSGSGSGSGEGNKTEEPKTEKPSNEKVEETKTETQKSQSSGTAKAANKAKAEVAKPAILVTGDIVGVQKADDGSRDARGTMSFTKVKGDGTASLGFSADYMVNAKIGNVTVMRSWMGANSKGNKHINVISDGFSVLPKAWSNTALFVRVNSIKNFTALYGGAGTYGKMYGEEMISTLAIGGFMYKGNLTKSINATIIAACVYSPYSKYYTESLFKSKPIVIPFINLNYKLTKTFGVGLTGGGTYIAGQNILNYQILLGTKLLL